MTRELERLGGFVFSDKRSYRPPRLVAYGLLNTLTRGGSGTAQEQACTPDTPPPGCNPDPTKWRP